MPGIQDVGPSGIAAPNPANLVQPLEAAATPDAVATMINAFRQGQISAQDIIDRAGELGQAKRKAELVQAQFAASPEAIEARKQTALMTAAKAKSEAENAGIAQITQANKLKHENAVALLGVNGPKIDAAYTSVGRLIPLKPDPINPGVEIPDREKIQEELPKITQFATVRAKQATIDAAWQPEKVTRKDASGREVVAEGWVNAITGEKSAVKPLPKNITFDNWLESVKPGTVQVTPIIPEQQVIQDTSNISRMMPPVSPLPQPVTAPAVQPTAQPAAQPIVQPQNLFAGTPYADWRVTEVKEAPQEQVQQVINNAAQRFQSNIIIQGLQNAKQAYDAAQDVLGAINPDGSYAKNLAATPKQADYKLMVNYAKILDPNSVVREGEITLLAGTKSQWGRITDIKTNKDFSDYVQAMTGQKIFTSRERAGMKSLLERSYENRIASAKEVRDASAKALRDAGATENQINAALPMPSVAPGAAARGSATTGEQKTIAGGAVMERGPDGNWRLKSGGAPAPSASAPSTGILGTVEVAPLVIPK